MGAGNGERIRLWNDRAALWRQIIGAVIAVIVTTSGATGLYFALDGRVSAADKNALDAIERTKENKATIQQLKDNVDALTIGQAVLNEAVVNDRQNNADFRERTDDALKSIIKKLDKARERDVRSDGR